MINVSDDEIIISDDIDNLIYLVGSARGGTSILFRSLSIHPEIYRLPAISHFYSNVWRSRRCMHKRLFSKVYKSLLWFDVSKATKDLSGKNKDQINSMLRKAIKNKDFSMLYKMYPIVSFLIDRNNDPTIEKSSCWADKSNDWRGLYKINKSFPKSKFIFIVRDPRAVVLSSATRQSKKDGMTNFDSRNIINQAVDWKWMVDRMLSFKKNNPHKTKIIHYEDFVSNPSTVLNELFLFLCGFKMDENDIVEKINDLSGSSTNRDEKYKGISSKSMNRWKDELSELDTQLIENIVGRTMTNKVISYVRSKPVINNASIKFFIRNNLFLLYMKSILSSILFFMRR